MMNGLNRNFKFSSQTGFRRPKSQKKLLRVFYKKSIDKLSPSLKKQKQKQITAFLSKMPFWETSGYIAVYQALKDEPCISSFYELWKDKICFPVVGDSSLKFYKPGAHWQKNIFSVIEPMPKPENAIQLNEISVFLIPGRAFDRNGARLGRGRGFYDKTLALVDQKKTFAGKKKNPLLKILKLEPGRQALFVGVAFSEQIHNEQLPVWDHDIAVDILVTDQFILKPVPQGVKSNKGGHTT